MTALALDVLTPEEAGALLRVPVKTVVQLFRQGRIPTAVKVGRRWRILRSGLSAMFAGNSPQVTPTSEGLSPVARSRSEILQALRDPLRPGRKHLTS